MNNGAEELQVSVHWTIQIGEELILSRDVAPSHNHEVENDEREVQAKLGIHQKL